MSTVTGDSHLWAHSRNAQGFRHSLVDHLRGTSALAAQFAQPFGGADVARWLGLVHDVGKASCAWQTGLDRAEADQRPVGIDHKSLGAQLATARCGWPFALAAFGHHGGLQTRAKLRGKLGALTDQERLDGAGAYESVARLIPEIRATEQLPTPEAWRVPLVMEMAVRMVFSALCDADFLDTAAHFDGATGPRVRPPTDFAALRDRFEKRRAALLAERPPAALDTLREEVYRGCVTAASAPPGVFRLPAPTGSGKTIAAAGFGLHHAAAHGHRRVIVAVPFLTITEQNAEVYRSLLDGVNNEPTVLEHHSGVYLDRDDSRSRWHRLAAENWDAPFVVTTFVRLFESLLGRRPAQVRRVHRVAGSVLVLDEVQALPHAMLIPILDALRTLVEHFGTTVVLSSATQPDFWELSPFAGLPATDMVHEPSRLTAALRRVRYQWRLDPKPSLVEIADEVARERAAMVVVNTTADAKAVHARWHGADAKDTAFHLSARMCPAHRRRVLHDVRYRLATGDSVLLVSTQLIEAGVDVDFPVVFRALAPADSLLQAAGRANREGRLSQLGRLVVFAPSDGGAPPSYPHLVGATAARFGPGKADPDDFTALRSYYQAVYSGLNLADPGHRGQLIQAARRRLDYPTLTDGPLDASTNRRDRRLAFRIIDDDGIAVVTPQGETDDERRALVHAAIERLQSGAAPQMADLRLLQPYTTNLHRSALRPAVAAMLRPILGPELAAGSLVEWVGGYDRATGIELDPQIEEYVL